MKVQTVWDLSYNDNKLNRVKDTIIQDIKDINSTMKKVFSNNCVIIVNSPCDQQGELLHHTEVHIFDNFIDANPMLNREQYRDDTNISVIHYNLSHDKFLFIFYKSFDMKYYKRFNKRQVETMFDKFGFESRIEFLYNEKQTTVIIHKPN